MNEYIYLGSIEETAEASEIRPESPDAAASDGGPAPGTVLARITQRNKFCVGDRIEIMKPDGRNVPAAVEAMYDGDLQPVESCPHSKQRIWLQLTEAAEQYDLLRVYNVTNKEADNR